MKIPYRKISKGNIYNMKMFLFQLTFFEVFFSDADAILVRQEMN